MAERSAVNREVVGSNPTPGVLHRDRGGWLIGSNARGWPGVVLGSAGAVRGTGQLSPGRADAPRRSMSHPLWVWWLIDRREPRGMTEGAGGVTGGRRKGHGRAPTGHRGRAER